MQIYKEKAALLKEITLLKRAGKTIGFVPTMGALHAGHISLVKNATENCDRVVVSIFINPTQFDNQLDLDKYPRSLEADITILQNLHAPLLVFIPSKEDLYGNNVKAHHFNFDGLENEMEGRFRTGHFDGVGTVVEKLFEIVKPDKAYFGEKDFQQLQIIRKLNEKQGLGVEIVGCPIDREINGLARSSRNERLNADMRKESGFIYSTLLEVKRKFGTENADLITQWVANEFNQHPFLKLEYFEIADSETLKSMHIKNPEGKYRAFIAAYAGDVRLIDNLALN